MLAKLVAQHSQTLSSTRCIIQAALKPLKKKKKHPVHTPSIFLRLQETRQSRPWLECRLKCILWTERPAYINMSLLLFLLPPSYQNHGVCHLLPSGIVWATVHYALTLCPRRPPAHLFIPQGFLRCLISRFFLRCVCTLLTSRWFPRQSRSACLWILSSDGCRTSVSAAWGPAGGREGKLESGRHLWWRFFLIEFVKSAHFEINGIV